MNNIKAWIGHFTEIVVSFIALGVVAGVVFGDAPFVGAIAANFAATVNMLGDAGASGALVLAILVGLYD
ncbi:MAG: hypothetical protein QF513_00415 [Gammaproteobacteria bacterium]|jgi:hypothetical protein|nr:hypothetical protein [Gammaproteobacteria bacterium]MBQ09250.1 hypothetical protein [Gammaproteobacteria bacterium]MDP6146244.1 hypothetical protein [Gammaproteobacteria bacterium]HJL80148.1 hypothetical protein [Gammaproteobacteria bacterium]HJN00977.1 hypothetical protein [Gammaproteobacteria bacterium]|tara:strand:- start:31632 stop:31838 length:207 start_codon:yes stop_codon:yes gene_type:complete